MVGIVGDVRNIRPDLAPRPQIYVPMEQSPAPGMTLVIRTNESAVSLGRSLRRLVAAIDKDQAITNVKSLETIVADASARWRVSASVFAEFGFALWS